MTLKSIKVQLSVFLILFAIYLSFIDKDKIFLAGLCISLIAAVITDSFITYLKTKKIIVTESSIVSGLIVGYVIASDQYWWIISLGSIFAIISKHFIRFKTRHIFNPAGFGILLTILIFNASTQWKGTYIWYIVIPAGIYFIWKIKKLELVASYFIASFILFGAQAAILHTAFSNISGYFSYFFIFIMMIEPMTTPIYKRGKIIFGAGVAIMIFLLYQAKLTIDTELLALLCLNLTVPFLNNTISHLRSGIWYAAK